MEASEDGRFVFAGLLRGSSEMLALDITDLPRWGTLPIGEVREGGFGICCAFSCLSLQFIDYLRCFRAGSVVLPTFYVHACSHLQLLVSCISRPGDACCFACSLPLPDTLGSQMKSASKSRNASHETTETPHDKPHPKTQPNSTPTTAGG